MCDRLEPFAVLAEQRTTLIANLDISKHSLAAGATVVVGKSSVAGYRRAKCRAMRDHRRSRVLARLPVTSLAPNLLPLPVGRRGSARIGAEHPRSDRPSGLDRQ